MLTSEILPQWKLLLLQKGVASEILMLLMLLLLRGLTPKAQNGPRQMKWSQGCLGQKLLASAWQLA